MVETRSKTVIFALLCAAAAFLCFLPSLSCYFFADDFLCLDYLSKIFSGRPQLLIERLFSPWQDDNIQLLYRPMGDISLALDYLLWQVNAFGYHLTNVLLHVACTVLVFFLAKHIFLQLEQKTENNLPAFLSALLFAVYPLHTENVIWIVGRLDLLCTLFFLVSFLSFIRFRKNNKNSYLYLSLTAFWCSLCSKEIALVLPLLLGAYIFLIEENKNKTHLEIKELAKVFMPYLVLAALFMSLRYMVLGTLIGGYTGTIGDAFTRSFARRLLDPTLYFLQFYPLNSEVIPQNGLTDQFMHALYIISGIFLFLRIPFCPWSLVTLRRMSFALVWLLITIAPTLQVMAIILNLSGGRVFYLPSVATVMLFVLMLYPFEEGNARNKIMPVLKAGACTILVVMAGIFGWICIRNNEPWITASNMILTLKKELASCLDKLPMSKKLLLVNMPSNYKGAHSFYEFSEILALMSPPLSPKNYADKIVILDWFAARNNINYSRLRRLSDDKDSYEIKRVHWVSSSPELLCDLGILSCASLPDKIDICWRKIARDERQKEGTDDILVFLKPARPASGLEFIDVSVEEDNGESAKWSELPETIQLDYEDKNGRFKSLQKNTERISSNENTDKIYSFAAGECVDWLNSGICRKFILHLPQIKNGYRVKNISLGGSEQSPVIKPDLNTLIEGNDSICRFKNKASGNFYFDATKVKGAAGVLIEISKPRYVYTFFDNSIRCPQDSGYTQKRIRVNGVSGIYPLTKNLFSIPARYQIHVCTLDKNGNAIGKFSDPLTFGI